MAKNIYILLFIICLLSGILSAQSYTKKDSVHYRHKELNYQGDTSLYVRTYPTPPANGCSYTLQKATFNLYFHLGKTYKYGTKNFSASVGVTVTAYSSYSDTLAKDVVEKFNATITLSRDKPEALFTRDFTGTHASINRFQVDITSYSSSALVQDSIQMDSYFKETWGIGVSSATLTNIAIPQSKTPQEFKWNTNCKDIPSYHFQLLRLYNKQNSGTYLTNEKWIKDTVRWERALNIVTDSKDTTLKLTIAEGRGYYLWRVRPIGSLYTGGYGDSRNLGSWSSSPAEGTALDYQGTPGSGAFFYHQFDDTVNWVFSRTHTENGRMSEQITYANTLEQGRQSQVRIFSDNVYLASHSVYDYSGRAALQTLAVPLATDSFNYKREFIKINSNLYLAANFDETAGNKYKNPDAATSLPDNYYFDSHSDPTIPEAQGYPFARTLYKSDGSGRPREESGPGDTYRLKNSGTDRTVKTFYGSASEQELIRIFGDEAAKDSSVTLEMMVDPNKVTSVKYIDHEGRVIATCLARGDNSLLDTLESSGKFTIRDTVRKSMPYGNHGTSSVQPMAFASSTPVTFHYRINPTSLQNSCPNYCRTCDYKVEILVHEEDTSYIAAQHTVTPASCAAPLQGRWDTTFIKTLGPGSYTIEKRVYANNLDPSTATATLSAKTYLQGSLDSLEKAINKQVDDSLAAVYGYLNRGSLDSLYSYYFGWNINVNNPDSVFADSSKTQNVGCGSVKIPVMLCPSYSCPNNQPDFEDYFAKRWPQYAGTSGGYLKYLQNDSGRVGYATGEFNTLINNMLTATVYGSSPYTCQQLWKCWDALVQNYETLRSKSNYSSYSPNYAFDLQRAFLDCAGRKLAGFSNTRTGSTGYATNAWKYFQYVAQTKQPCDSLLCPSNNCGNATWAQDSSSNPKNNKWEQLYRCTKDVQQTGYPRGLEPYYSKAKCGCEDAVEARYTDFKQAIIRMYHNDSIYVEGDVFKLQKDTIWGLKYGWSKDSLTSTPGNQKTMAEIECAARTMVEKAKEKCNLTVYKTGSTIDSVGSTAQLTDMKKVMTWSFDLKRNQSCGAGWDTLAPYSSPDNSLYRLWDKKYGTDINDQLWDIAEVKNLSQCGGYLLGGWTTKGKNNDVSDTLRGIRDYWVIRVNDNGDKMWDKIVGGTKGDSLFSIIETSDGGFLLGGCSKSGATGDKSEGNRDASLATYDYWVVKIDQEGRLQWNKRFGSTSDDWLKSITETSDGNFLLGGYTAAGISGDKTQAGRGGWDYWLVKINSSGAYVWDYRYGSPDDDILWSVRQMQDGNYLMGGYSDGSNTGGSNDRTTPNRGSWDYWLVKASASDGTKLWDTAYGGSSSDRLFSMEILSDGGFVMAGQSFSGVSGDKTTTNYGNGDVWVIKTNSAGKNKSEANFGGNNQEGGNNGVNEANDGDVKIKQTKDGGFIIGASSTSAINTGNKTDSVYGGASHDYWAIRLNASLTKQWDRSFGCGNDDHCNSISQDQEGYFWIAGYSFSGSCTGTNGNKTASNYDGGTTTSDYWVIKGRDYCTFTGFCYKWTDPTLPHDSTRFKFDPVSCERTSADLILKSLYMQKGEIIKKQLNTYAAAYKNTCGNAKNIKDTLDLRYDAGYHHYTLYYYDRAGNLIRTVAPKGVVTTSTTRMQHPTHTYQTKYFYNSLKQVITTQTPDGGTTQYWYDYKGRVRFSQNGKQKFDGKYSYTKYDYLGRPYEMGESSKNAASQAFVDSLDKPVFPTSTTLNGERTYIVYSTEPTPAIRYVTNAKQRNIRNRVSYTYTDDAAYTYFSYDAYGNVEWTVQQLPGLGKNYILYEYELLSGNVTKVRYNEGRIDAFYHRYSYDKDNRLIVAETSKDGYIWEKDAQYSYYKHGPLKRNEIGEDKIQGLDYVYTLQGWLKGINHPSLLKANDPGQDSSSTGMSKDVFGMVLGYHANDFNRTGSKFNPATTTLVSSNATELTDQFNGNISSITAQIAASPGGGYQYEQLTGHKYRYDYLYRIKKGLFNSYATGTWTLQKDYRETFNYDANGNITKLNRYGYGSGAAKDMDSLTYNYTANTNKLGHIDDIIAAGNYSLDLDDQSANNYLYDSLGQMISDNAENISAIGWTPYHKVRYVRKTNGDSIKFQYDAMGERISKTVKPGSGPVTVTYYVQDPQGNLMSLYERTTSGADWIYKQEEIPLYASARVGQYNPSVTAKVTANDGTEPFGCISCIQSGEVTVAIMPIVDDAVNGFYYFRNIAKKEYELNDHLGNVRVTVSDRKTSIGNDSILSYSNYYAYGSPHAGRVYTPFTGLSAGYRYGFNGMEQDVEIKTNGNSYTTDFRQYDPRVGRWLTRDPIIQYWQSDYTAMDNNPICFVDPEGLKAKGPWKVWDKVRNIFGKGKKHKITPGRGIKLPSLRKIIRTIGKGVRYVADFVKGNNYHLNLIPTGDWHRATAIVNGTPPNGAGRIVEDDHNPTTIGQNAVLGDPESTYQGGTIKKTYRGVLRFNAFGLPPNGFRNSWIFSKNGGNKNRRTLVNRAGIVVSRLWYGLGIIGNSDGFHIYIDRQAASPPGSGPNNPGVWNRDWYQYRLKIRVKEFRLWSDDIQGTPDLNVPPGHNRPWWHTYWYGDPGDLN